MKPLQILRSLRDTLISPATSSPMTFTHGQGTTTLPGFHLDIRAVSSERSVSAGENCVLGCSIVVENDKGSIVIGDNTYISGGTTIISACGVKVGSDVLIAWGCTIVDHDSHSLDWTERARDVASWRKGIAAGGLTTAATLKNWAVVPMAAVHIGDKAWLGFNVIVLKGVTIGEGAVVAAGSVVTKDVSPWTLAAGNPARTIKELPRP